MLAKRGGFQYYSFLRADVAQLVEHDLAKVGVAGSNPVVRSIDYAKVGRFPKVDRPSSYHGDVAKW